MARLIYRKKGKAMKTEMERKMEGFYIRKKAEELIQQGRYQEACDILDRLSALEDMEQLSRKDISPVLHNGKVTGWELGAIDGQA